jgi:hypothetical protein
VSRSTTIPYRNLTPSRKGAKKQREVLAADEGLSLCVLASLREPFNDDPLQEPHAKAPRRKAEAGGAGCGRGLSLRVFA